MLISNKNGVKKKKKKQAWWDEGVRNDGVDE